MDLFSYFQDHFQSALDECVLHHNWPPTGTIVGEAPRNPSHGDIALPLPLMMARHAKRDPMALAEELAAALHRQDVFHQVHVHRPGFVNLVLREENWQALFHAILERGTQYGHQTFNRNLALNIEFVSANPTGPLTLANARGAIIGDVLASLLSASGATIKREYYVNDSGKQIDHLAYGLWHRLQEQAGLAPGPFPKDSYPGEYLKEIAAFLWSRDGKKWLVMEAQERHQRLRKESVAILLAGIKDSLGALGVTMDTYTSEQAFIDARRVDDVVAALESKDLVYEGHLPPPEDHTDDEWEERQQLLFRATSFGDDRDRPLRKSDGSWTYFATDIAYHFDKVKRLEAREKRGLVDIVGADHSGYIPRIAASIKALCGDEVVFIPIVCQIVRLLEGNEVQKMSKRSGKVVTVHDILQQLNRDVLRFQILMRTPSAPLDIDVAQWVKESKDNPVYYVQYAHARICSLRRKAGETLWSEALTAKQWIVLNEPWEHAIRQSLAQWPRTIQLAAKAYEPHRLGPYLYRLASQVHHAWSLARQDKEARFIVPEAPEKTKARLCLLECARLVLSSGLGILGVEPKQEMRHDTFV